MLNTTKKMLSPREFALAVQDTVRDFILVRNMADIHDQTITIEQQLKEFVQDKTNTFAFTDAVILETFNYWKETNTTPDLITLKQLF